MTLDCLAVVPTPEWYYVLDITPRDRSMEKGVKTMRRCIPYSNLCDYSKLANLKVKDLVTRMMKTATSIPEGTEFKPFKNILLAVKSAIIRKKEALNPLIDFKNNFKYKLNHFLKYRISFKYLNRNRLIG